VVVDAIIHAFLSIVTAILSVFPTLPAIDPSIASAGTWLTTTLGQGSAFAREVYGATLLTTIVGILIAIWSFEPIYHAVMWVIRKIPFIHIS